MAKIKRVFTCASCGTEIELASSAKFCRIQQAKWFRSLCRDGIPLVCEGCFNDGVLDDININGDMASVNTLEVY